MNSVSVAFELMIIELQKEVESLNNEGVTSFRNSDYELATSMSERGKALTSFCEKVTSLSHEWDKSFASEFPEEKEATDEAARKIQSTTKNPKTGLLVKFEDGTIISEETAAMTLVRAFEKIGFERVVGTSVIVNSEPIVSRYPSKKNYGETEIRGFFVKTHSSTQQKKKNLEDAAAQLGLRVSVEVI